MGDRLIALLVMVPVLQRRQGMRRPRRFECDADSFYEPAPWLAGPFLVFLQYLAFPTE